MGSRIASIFLRQTSRAGSFITVCFINMLLNFRWSIPAWLMLAAYLIFGVPPLWVFWVALSLWPLAAILMTAIVRLLRMLVSMSGGVSSGHSGGTVVHVDEHTANKNPYSATRQKEEKVKAGYSSAYAVEGHDWYAGQTPSGETQNETSGAEPQPWHAPQPASYPEVEGHDWYAEYRQSEEYKREQNPAAEAAPSETKNVFGD